MATMISVPEDLVEQVRSLVAASQAEIEKFFAEAARKRLREIKAKQAEAEYYQTHARLSPRQVFERSLKEVLALETKYGMSSEEFIRGFEAGEIDEDPDDPIIFYHWRTLHYGLQHMEKEFGFQREMILDEQRAV